ncbi:protein DETOXIFICATION 56-like [Prunus yedoensis var. nudiflora]|uniref:Protein DETOXIFICATION n=1 Tax=Prunus yedoensis var. nudiflora TaxID=2094558 RepID=A0A314ZRA0_PRUYE|nr:protein DETOXIFICATION 56-like [Prunus yedoensis var. nudiflora]
MSATSNLEEDPRERASLPPSSLPLTQKWPANFFKVMLLELKIQRGIALPLVAMNLTWFAKIAITTAFLGRLGELQLAGGTLGFTFANVTGFSVLNGLCGAMEPICGQASGAKINKLLHKTLLMTTSFLLLATLPISFLWLNVDKILIHFGQQEDISTVAKSYLLYLLPDLHHTTFNVLLALALALHIPINILLAKSKGLEGIAMSVWITDLMVVLLLALLLKLCGPCCLTTCLEWWCYEILVLLTGRLANAKQAVGVLAIVLNFDYLLYSVMLSLATCASTRVSNELGANRAGPAYQSAFVSVAVSVVSGCIGGLVMLAARGSWGSLFSHNKGIVGGVKKMLLLMSLVEVVNFPLAVCGGIVRGTARPWLAMYANLGGFYLLALPLGVVLAFKVALGLSGLLIGFLIGMVACLILLLMFVARINWDEEACKAQALASVACQAPELDKDGNHKRMERADVEV